MSQDKIDHQDDLKGASRRSRKDQQGRDYVCGCGKKYLSYPALYTHIKTKHDGHQPEGTQKTGTTPVSRRAKQKIDQKILREIQNFVQFQNLKILAQLDQNALGSIPISSRIKKQLLNKQLFQAYNALSKLNNVSPLEKKTSLQTVLIYYLIGVGQFTSQSMFQYYCQFAKLFRNCFHQYGNQIYDTCFKNDDFRKDKIFNIQESRLAPIICDFFLRFYVPYQIKDADIQNITNVMELICYDFCQWLFVNKITIVQVSMNKSHSILKRNLIQPKSKDKKSQFDKQLQDKQQKQESQEHLSSIDESQMQKKDEQKDKQNQIKVGQAQQMQSQEQMRNQNKQQNQH